MRNVLTCLLLVLVFARVASAQDTPANGIAYHISAQDVLDITVQDHAELSRTVTVLPDNTISFPYVGEIVVSGLTLAQLSERIGSALRKQIANPMVSVTVKSLHEAPVSEVSVLGAVKIPGKRLLKKGWRILDLLTDAGGLVVGAESVSATLIRGGSETQSVDIPRVLSVVDHKANLLLERDDVLLIHELDAPHNQAQILGEVVRPGYYTVVRDGDINSFIGEAGGVTPRAALSKATITHNDKTEAIDLRLLVTTGKAPAGIKISAGDTIFIPQNRQFYALFGAVAHPGVQDYPDDKPVTVLSALSLAGVQTAGTNLKAVSIIHPMKEGKPSVVTVNVEAMLKKGDLSHDVALQPGDIVYVSEKSGRRGPVLGDVLSYLPLLALMGL